MSNENGCVNHGNVCRKACHFSYKASASPQPLHFSILLEHKTHKPKEPAQIMKFSCLSLATAALLASSTAALPIVSSTMSAISTSFDPTVSVRIANQPTQNSEGGSKADLVAFLEQHGPNLPFQDQLPEKSSMPHEEVAMEKKERRGDWWTKFCVMHREHPWCSPYNKRRSLPTEGEDLAANMKQRRRDWFGIFCAMHHEHPWCSPYNKKRSLPTEGEDSAANMKERRRDWFEIFCAMHEHPSCSPWKKKR
jgi:hypothetical protein